MVAGEIERVSWGAGVQGEPVRFADRWDMEKRNRRSKDDSRVLPMALVLAFCLFYWSVYKDGVIRGSIQKERQIVQCVGAILFYFINLINKMHRVSISRHALC